MATKKVIKTTKTNKKVISSKPKAERKTTRQSSEKKASSGSSWLASPLIFGKENFKWMLIGVGVILLGYILMIGGEMPSPDVWEPERIYSFRRITLAPIVILIGLGIEIYAIFKK